jgi:hypothetical protein
LDAILLVLAALAMVVPPLGTVPVSAEWHIMGAGFVNLLILGQGTNLLPGFAGRRLRGEGLVWAVLGLANLAVVLRVCPVVFSGLFAGSLRTATLAASGLAGVLAVALFAYNLSGPRHDEIHPSLQVVSVRHSSGRGTGRPRPLGGHERAGQQRSGQPSSYGMGRDGVATCEVYALL